MADRAGAATADTAAGALPALPERSPDGTPGCDVTLAPQLPSPKSRPPSSSSAPSSTSRSAFSKNALSVDASAAKLTPPSAVKRGDNGGGGKGGTADADKAEAGKEETPHEADEYADEKAEDAVEAAAAPCPRPVAARPSSSPPPPPWAVEFSENMWQTAARGLSSLESSPPAASTSPRPSAPCCIIFSSPTALPASRPA